MRTASNVVLIIQSCVKHITAMINNKRCVKTYSCEICQVARKITKCDKTTKIQRSRFKKIRWGGETVMVLLDMNK